ncbi:hypothetical protein [Pseudomonas anguilliseptica]|uniref:Uncharacterized protein n=1 Tax=Pseudomonas anguilliseptica TaxID=53406 RepID=A0A1H5D796_PSEAG|nr:hypothetical protein [Pseudomonas anguilliseptica]SED74714.1 hypothetical protein SAMN05421553_3244 [Pseudomonas anguilliseptica]
MSGNDVEVSGEQNRVAGRDFIEINLGGRPDERALLPAQRKELHQLRAQCEELGDDPRAVWREIHTQLSVTGLDEVTAAQFVQARGVIQARLERLQEEADKKRLTEKIDQIAAEKGAYQELNNFCELSFGRTQLSLLKRAELPKALEFIQQFEAKPAEPSAAPHAAAKLELREFLITYHWNAAGLFVFGLLVGGFWF